MGEACIQKEEKGTRWIFQDGREEMKWQGQKMMIRGVMAVIKSCCLVCRHLKICFFFLFRKYHIFFGKWFTSSPLLAVPVGLLYIGNGCDVIIGFSSVFLPA